MCGCLRYKDVFITLAMELQLSFTCCYVYAMCWNGVGDVCMEWIWCMNGLEIRCLCGMALELFLVVHYWSTLFSWALWSDACVESPLEFCGAMRYIMLLGFSYQKQWELLPIDGISIFWGIMRISYQKTEGIVVDFPAVAAKE